MFVPIVRKIIKSNDVFVERALPAKGDLVASVGESIEPFTKLGMTKVSHGKIPLNKGFKMAKGKTLGSYFYTGDTLGRVKRKRIIAPFDGQLVEKDNSFVFQQEKKDFWLLGGVWGDVTNVIEGVSALVKTQTLDIHLAVCTPNSYSGELIVFPNLSELLEMQYLEKFSKDSFGKVIYVGNYVSVDLVRKAAQLGVAGLVGGSIDRHAFVECKKANMFVGGISGFGMIPTPSYIFDVLKGVSSRYVFLQGEKQVLRIPARERFAESEVKTSKYTMQLRKLRKNLLVQVFEKPHFGWVGKVYSITGDEIHVILDGEDDPVKIKIPNIISLE